MELARDFVSQGVGVAAATPHVREDYPTTAEEMRTRVQVLRAELAAHSIPLHLLPGGEISLDFMQRLTVEELLDFGLAGNTSYLLLEFPYMSWPLALTERALGLLEQGVTPVLAHPERNPDVQAAPDRLQEFVEAGVLVQVTAASLAGRFGRMTKASALRLLDLGLVHLVSSDAHGPGQRLEAMTRVEKAVSDRALASWLTVGVPSAIVKGERLPPRPQPGQVRRWRRLLRRGR